MKQGSKAIRYGQLGHWKNTSSRVGAIFGKMTSGNTNLPLQVEAPESDRRPPDTSEALSKLNKERIHSKWGRSEREKKPLVQALGGRTALKSSQIVGGGEPPNSYQSYPHYGNSCYITAPSEVLYACFLRDHRFWTEHVGSLPGDFGIKKIYESFIIREKATGSVKDVLKVMNTVSRH